MKTGFENKRNLVILALLAVVLIAATVYFVRYMFGGSASPASAPATASSSQNGSENAAAPAEARDANGHAAKKLPALEKLDPTLHPEVMAGAESLQYSGKGRNIFSMNSAPVVIPQVIATARPQPVVRTGSAWPGPPRLPIDLKFFGYSADNGAKKAFLLHGDDVFIANEGDVVDHHYKVLKISPLSIQVTDLLYNNTQTLPLTQS